MKALAIDVQAELSLFSAQAHDMREAAQERESTGESPTAHKRAYGSRMPDIPVCFDARLPPLHPKKCSHLTNLASAHGSLFAGETFLLATLIKQHQGFVIYGNLLHKASSPSKCRNNGYSVAAIGRVGSSEAGG